MCVCGGGGEGGKFRTPYLKAIRLTGGTGGRGCGGGGDTFENFASKLERLWGEGGQHI